MGWGQGKVPRGLGPRPPPALLPVSGGPTPAGCKSPSSHVSWLPSSPTKQGHSQEIWGQIEGDAARFLSFFFPWLLWESLCLCACISCHLGPCARVTPPARPCSSSTGVGTASYCCLSAGELSVLCWAIGSALTCTTSSPALNCLCRTYSGFSSPSRPSTNARSKLRPEGQIV